MKPYVVRVETRTTRYEVPDVEAVMDGDEFDPRAALGAARVASPDDWGDEQVAVIYEVHSGDEGGCVVTQHKGRN